MLPFKIKHGTTTIVGASWREVVFDVPFNSVPTIVVSYSGNPSSTNIAPLKTQGESITGFQVCMAGTNGSGNRNVNWIAIGI